MGVWVLVGGLIRPALSVCELELLKICGLEVGVFVQGDVLDAGSQLGEGPVGIGRGEEEGFGAEEGGVAGGGDLVDGEGEEADTDGALAVDVVAEGAGEVDMGDWAEVIG